MNRNFLHIDFFKLTLQIALGFFLLAAILGTLMRFIYIQEIPFLDYRHILHAHSHIALMGWGFTILAGTLVYFLLPELVKTPFYRYSLTGNFIAGIGMFFSFLYQGYGVLSIFFCTLHLFVAYYFSWHFLKNIKNIPPTNSIKFAKWAVIWMLISTIGLWSISPISMFLGKLHPLYFAAIQFFLHLQFNGWFTFGLLSLLFKHVENKGHILNLPKSTFWILQLSLVLTYSLSITWSTPEDFLFYINSLGVVLQIIALFLFIRLLKKGVPTFLKDNNLAMWMLRLGLYSLCLKILVQGAVAMPFIAKVSYIIRNFVIGFIHLSMLGAFSLSLLGILIYRNLLPEKAMAKWGYSLLVLGFILTESILFIQGILLWSEKGFMSNYYAIIFGATAILPIALVLIFISLIKRKNNSLLPI